jgi:hypothetical protein
VVRRDLAQLFGLHLELLHCRREVRPAAEGRLIVRDSSKMA